MIKKKATVVIVDDDATVTTRLRARLEDLNFHVLTAGSHNSAIELMKVPDKNIKIIIVDLALKLTDTEDKSIEFLGTQVIDFAKKKYNDHIKVVGLSYLPFHFAKTITPRMDAYAEKKGDYLSETIGIVEYLFKFGKVKPKIFIGSSLEGKDIANAIHLNQQHYFECTVWDQDVFKLSDYALENLLEILEHVNFAIFVFSPDDISKVRDVKHSTARDNVIFELGLAISSLGRKNVFYIIPIDNKIKIPTDLLGLTPGHYEIRSDNNWVAATAAFCFKLKKQIL